MTLDELLSDYWDAAYAEGVEGRAHDTPDGVAQKTLNAIHEEVRRLVAEGREHTWQPIETAPRDESVILLGYIPHPRIEGSRRVYEGRWNDEQQTWTSVNGFLLHTEATHWMPLPDPPKDCE